MRGGGRGSSYRLPPGPLRSVPSRLQRLTSSLASTRQNRSHGSSPRARPLHGHSHTLHCPRGRNRCRVHRRSRSLRLRELPVTAWKPGRGLDPEARLAAPTEQPRPPAPQPRAPAAPKTVFQRPASERGMKGSPRPHPGGSAPVPSPTPATPAASRPQPQRLGPESAENWQGEDGGPADTGPGQCPPVTGGGPHPCGYTVKWSCREGRIPSQICPRPPGNSSPTIPSYCAGRGNREVHWW